MSASRKVTTRVAGRELTLSNLDKVLYPSGFTKGEVIDYYARIGEVMVPHLANRCLTFKRFPDGTDRAGFFEKRCPKHRPEWVPVSLGPSDRRGGIEYCRSTRRPRSCGRQHRRHRDPRPDGRRRRSGRRRGPWCSTSTPARTPTSARAARSPCGSARCSPASSSTAGARPRVRRASRCTCR